MSLIDARTDSSIDSTNERLKHMLLVLGIVVALTALPIAVSFLVPAKTRANWTAYFFQLTVFRYPGLLALCAVVTTLLIEIVALIAPLPPYVREAFGTLSRLLNTVMWFATALLLVIWLVTQAYDSYALQVGWLTTEDFSLILTPQGRLKLWNLRETYKNVLDDARKTNSTPNIGNQKLYENLWNYVSGSLEADGFPSLDIRPSSWITILSKESRALWGPIIEAITPYHEAVKKTLELERKQ